MTDDASQQVSDLRIKADDYSQMLEKPGFRPSRDMMEDLRNAVRRSANTIEALTAERDAMRAALVKPLEWRGSDPDYTNADCTLGRIEIINTFHDSGFMVQMAGTKGAAFRPTMDAAKAAAQADYEARIRSCLINPEAK